MQNHSLIDLNHALQPFKVATDKIPADLIEIGRVSGPFGVRGQVKIYLHNDGEILLASKEWFLQLNGQTYCLKNKEARRHQETHIVASLEGFSTPEQIESYRHASILMPKSSLPKLEKDEYYWSDLIGKKVYNLYPDAQTPTYLGVVDHLLETPGQALLAIASQEGQAKHHQILIPFLDAYVKTVDLKTGEITVEWHF